MNKKTGVALGKRKTAVIGVGYVGASIAYALTVRNLAREIVLIDTNKQKAQGEALDIKHGIPYMGISDVYAGDYSDISDCDLIIITAGRNRKPGETRLNLIEDNRKIMKSVTDSIAPYYKQGTILIVSNPVDILVSLCDKWMGLPKGMVFGTGCLLDTSRLTCAVAEYVGLRTEAIKAVMVGEHGDAQIPVWSSLTVGGVPMQEYCASVGLPWSEAEKRQIASRVKTMGATIIAAKEKTHYGIATCVCMLADAVLNQRPTIASVTSPLCGEYGITDVSLSLPSIIGVRGVERKIEEKWDDDETNAFHSAAKKLQDLLSTLT